MKVIFELFKYIIKKFERNKLNFSNIITNLYNLKHDLATLYA